MNPLLKRSSSTGAQSGQRIDRLKILERGSEIPAAVFDALLAQRVRVATMDLRIASIVLSRGMVLVTRNMSDFRKVPGLPIEDWTSSVLLS